MNIFIILRFPHKDKKMKINAAALMSGLIS